MIVLMLFLSLLSAGKLVGTDLTQAVPLTAAAALGALVFGHVDFGVTTSIHAGQRAGVLIGSFLSSRAPDRYIRPIITFVIFASGLKYVGVGTTALGWILCAVALAGGGYWLARTQPWRNGQAVPAVVGTAVAAPEHHPPAHANGQAAQAGDGAAGPGGQDYSRWSAVGLAACRPVHPQRHPECSPTYPVCDGCRNHDVGQAWVSGECLGQSAGRGQALSANRQPSQYAATRGRRWPRSPISSTSGGAPAGTRNHSSSPSAGNRVKPARSASGCVAACM